MHTLTAELLRREVRVLVVGCGGNGTAVAAGLPYLHQAMLVAGHPGGLRVTLMDGNIISPANCVRQPFSSAELGLAKAIVMVSRLNLFWRLSWTAIPELLSEQSKIGDYCLERSAQLKPETVTVKDVLANHSRKRVLGMIPIPGTKSSGTSSSR